ncbi:MAG TPA: HYR domain-containing protein, partial [Verrucomicrobiae bacterium]|nr:HYR domain-containing protein [Verrucomicrobiae bacterium]
MRISRVVHLSTGTLKLIPGFILLCVGTMNSPAATNTVTTLADGGAGSLRQVLASSANGDVIDFSVTGTVVVSSELVISNNVNILGPVSNQVAISGGGTTRVFFIDPGAPGATNPPTTGPTVYMSHLIIADGMAKGGNGGDANNSANGAGGGAAGMGGALFVNGGTVAMAHVIFSGNGAFGGDGGSILDQFGGVGGAGGGGFGQAGGTNSDTDGATGGNGGNLGGAGGVGGTFYPVLSGTAGDNGQEGGGGGGGGGSQEAAAGGGGRGGFGAGGGGGGYADVAGGAGGNGGFGGGGGGGGNGFSSGDGGSGGSFGGKAGSVYVGVGGVLSGGAGGGGAGLGGAIFIRQGSLSLLYATFTNNAAHGGNVGAGLGGDSGQGKAGAIFVNVGANVCTNTGCVFRDNSAADASNTADDNNDIYGSLPSCPNTPPVAVCTNITVEVGPYSCSVDLPQASVDGGSYDPDEDPIMVEQIPSGPYNFGQTPVTLMVSDDRGGMDECPATITVVDKIPPVPLDSTLETNIGQCEVDLSIFPPPEANDNCGIGGPIQGLTFDPLLYEQQGTFTVQWVYEDMNLNTSTQLQTVIVHDTMPPQPQMDPLPMITEECEVLTVPTPEANDNCAGPLIGTTTDPRTYTNQGNFTIHWVYDDMHGNVVTQLQSVVIHDDMPPTISPCPSDITTGPLPGQCGATVTYAAPSAFDNCGPPAVICTPPSGSFFTLGTNKVACVATDVGGNTASCTFSVIVTQAPLCSITVSGNGGGATTVCPGTPLVLTAANGMKHYLWTGPEQNGSTLQTIVVSTPGTYFCSQEPYYSPSFCCSVTISNYPAPPCNITGDLLITNGIPTTLIGPDGMLSQYWTGPQNNGLGSRSNTVSLAGTYQLHLTDSNGCQTICSVVVTNRTPAPCSITASGDAGGLTICQGRKTTLTAANGMASYLWSGPEQNGATSKSIVVGTQGTYTVRQIDYAGLTNACSVFLTVHPLPPATISGTLTFCQGTNTTLSGPDGMVGYTWLGPQHNGLNAQSNTVSLAGTY